VLGRAYRRLKAIWLECPLWAKGSRVRRGHALAWADARQHVPKLQQSRRFEIATAFACSTPIKSRLTIFDGGPPCTAKPLLFTRWDNPLPYAWTPLCQRRLPRRHIGVTCGASRTPRVGRCSRERWLIRSMGANAAKP